MPNRPLLQDDARYPAFLERYQNDLGAFAAEVCGIELTPELALAYGFAGEPGARLSISSELDERIDKIGSLAPIALWNLLSRLNSRTLVAIPWGNVRSRWERYVDLTQQIRRGPHAWLAEYITISINRIFISYAGAPGAAEIRFLTASHPETLAGFFGDNLYWLMEDAQSINEQCVAVIMSSLHSPDASVAMSAPARANNWFLSLTRARLNRDVGGPWHGVVIDAPKPLQTYA